MQHHPDRAGEMLAGMIALEYLARFGAVEAFQRQRIQKGFNHGFEVMASISDDHLRGFFIQCRKAGQQPFDLLRLILGGADDGDG